VVGFQEIEVHGGTIAIRERGLKKKRPYSPPSGRGWGRDANKFIAKLLVFLVFPSPNPSRREGNKVGYFKMRHFLLLI
jgi:hypothetical protein